MNIRRFLVFRSGLGALLLFVWLSPLAPQANAASGAPIWTNRYDGPVHSYDTANAVAADSGGNVFVAGASIGSGGSFDYATVAYSSTGEPLWTNRYSEPINGNSYAYAIAVDSNGRVFVTGSSSVSVFPTRQGIAILAYSAGGILLWTNFFIGSGNTSARPAALAVDGGGNVFVTGQLQGAYATVAYSGNGISLWTNLYVGPGDIGAVANSIAVDSSGNIFVTGYATGSSTDYVTIKYASILPAARLEFQTSNDRLVLSWTNSFLTLQSATIVTDSFTNIPGASSPYTNAFTGSQQYFRLKAK